jgi:L-serine dehydratase
MTSRGSLFDIMGPVMIGPSSSHTAGAVRLAQLARNVASKPVVKVEFTLYNSFAKTYQGHGTDRGLLAGIMGIRVDDESIRDIFDKVQETSLEYQFIPYEEPNHYPPNTVRFDLTLEDGEMLIVVGHSVGGGKVYISKINEYNVSLRGEYPTVVMFYKDQPGMIWQVTKIIAEKEINIASLNCSRRDKGTEAFMSICLDSPLPQEQVEEIRKIPGVFIVHNVDKLH